MVNHIMEPMKTKMNRMLCSSDKINAGQCEIRPGGMLVQKRNTDTNSPTSHSPITPTIRVRVKHGSSYHLIHISSQASFGELKKKLAEATGLHHEEQKLMFKDKERDSKEFLDIARVKDGSKVLLIEDVARREQRRLELRRNAKVDMAVKSLAEINLEVDKLQMQVKGLDSMACAGGKVVGVDIDNLIEKLMSRLIQLDGIVVEGDLKIQRRMQVRRVQKNIETLDMLKQQIGKASHGKTIDAETIRDRGHENSIRDMPRLPKLTELNRANCAPNKNTVSQRPILMKHSESVVVTTKWETFD